MKLRKILIFVLFMFASVFALNLSVNVKAATGTTTYTISSTTAVTSNDTPEGTTATFNNTYTNNKQQLTKDKSMTLNLSGYEGYTITGLTLSMKSNKSAGAGTLSVKAGNTDLAAISSPTVFSSWYNMTSYTTSFVDVEVELTNNSYVIKENENITIVIAATTNSLYCQSFTLTYEEPASLEPETPTDAFTEVSTMASLNVSYTQEGEESWKLVTDAATLSATDEVVIVASESDVALSTTQNNNNRGQAAVTKENGSVIFGADVQVLTLEEGTVDGTFAFNTGEGYLFAASSGSNYLKTEADLSANSSWKITIADGVATIVAQGANTRNTMQYNSSSSLFACYSSASQAAVSLYKHIGSATYEVSSASIMFGTLIEEELYTNLTSVANTQFGVIYGVGKSAEELKAAIAEVNAGTKTFEDMKTATGLRSLAPEVAKVNEEGVEDANGEFYQFGVSINNIAESKLLIILLNQNLILK